MSITRWAKAGCVALDLDDEIQPGDWVADCLGEDRSTGVPGDWVRADGTIGRTPRWANVFACRPTEKGGEA